jgi:hypothetical protein
MFGTIAEFEAHVRAPAVQSRMRSWAKRVTIHHTQGPTVAQWVASGNTASCKGVIKTWRDTNGWPTGPNMIICPDGIILASGIDGPGIHASVCNGDGIGIEIVGNYDKGYWQEPIRSFVFGAVVALSRALGNTATDIVSKHRVNGHRECNSPKTCPGIVIDLDKVRRDVATRMAIIVTTDVPVIGVPPSITADQFKRYLYKYGAPVIAGELDRIYTLAAWLEIDPAFLAAVWKQEAFVDDPTDTKPGVAVIGGSSLQRHTRCPLNIVESQDSTRSKIYYNGRYWRAFSTWQLGLMDSLLYLKETHGAMGRLTVREVIPVHAPSGDGNVPETFITNVFTRMKEMQTL